MRENDKWEFVSEQSYKCPNQNLKVPDSWEDNIYMGNSKIPRDTSMFDLRFIELANCLNGFDQYLETVFFFFFVSCYAVLVKKMFLKKFKFSKTQEIV